MKWEDVDWQKHSITVRHEVAKQTSRKWAIDVLFRWKPRCFIGLGLIKGRSGFSFHWSIARSDGPMEKLCLHSKVNPLNNAFRHSYASYCLRLQAKRGWASFPNERAILRSSANGISRKHLLEKKARVGLRFGAPLALPSRACCQSCLVCLSSAPPDICPPRTKSPQSSSV